MPARCTRICLSGARSVGLFGGATSALCLHGVRQQHGCVGARSMAARSKAESGVKPPRVRDEQPAREPPKVVAVALRPRHSLQARKDLYEVGEIPPLGHVPKQMYAWAIRKERHGPPETGHAGRGAADLGARQPRRAGARDGGGRQLQRRVGGARQADLAARRAQEPLSHRRLRRVRHHLRGRLQGEALEGRRRGRHPLQPGRRRRRGVQRRRSDVLALASASGATRRRTAPSPSSAACRTAS